jgi:hypothetical protein
MFRIQETSCGGNCEGVGPLTDHAGLLGGSVEVSDHVRLHRLILLSLLHPHALVHTAVTLRCMLRLVSLRRWVIINVLVGHAA